MHLAQPDTSIRAHYLPLFSTAMHSNAVNINLAMKNTTQWTKTTL